jgi:hypothetical protein
MDDSVNTEVGVITQLSEKQEEVRDIILASRETDDKSMEDGLLANLGHDDDLVIGLVLAKLEIERPNEEPIAMDVMWAGAFLDHLDTLGYRMVRKR